MMMSLVVGSWMWRGKWRCSEESGNKYFIEESGDQQARRVKRANDQVTLNLRCWKENACWRGLTLPIFGEGTLRN